MKKYEACLCVCVISQLLQFSILSNYIHNFRRNLFYYD